MGVPVRKDFKNVKTLLFIITVLAGISPILFLFGYNPLFAIIGIFLFSFLLMISSEVMEENIYMMIPQFAITIAYLIVIFHLVTKTILCN